MKTIYSSILIAPCVLVYATIGRADESLKSASLAPAKIVEHALQGELEGEDRAKLLTGAVALDPDYAPARWQLGQMKLDGAWLNVNEVPAHAAGDADYAAYLKKRDALVDTAEQHRELARWCRGRHLSAEEKLHWSKVLGFERDDREALTALGVRWHEGRLLTREQIDSSKRESGERIKTVRAWRSQMVKWRQAIEGKDARKRALASGELARLSDASALAALESVFATDQSGESADRLNLALIGVAGRIPQPEATAILLRRAMTSESSAVVDAACVALKKRPMHAYVPQLLAALPDAVKSNFRVYMLPDGSVTHEHTVEIVNSAGAKQIFTHDSIMMPTDLAAARRMTPIALASELNKAARIEASAAALEGPNRRLRQRLQLILKETTGFEDVTDPELLAEQFAEHYGWSKPEKSTEVRREHTSELAAVFSMPQERQGHGECFVAGTPVMTISGPRAIESLKAGDRVLAQDPKSGELGYKTVQDRTLRMGAKVVKLKIGSETITATYGHPFWVVGTGWKVAGHMNVGARLRGLEQDFVVGAIEEARPTEVYNLLVSDHATYFVGAQRLLVHDDSQVLENGRAVPGLIAKAK